MMRSRLSSGAGSFQTGMSGTCLISLPSRASLPRERNRTATLNAGKSLASRWRYSCVAQSGAWDLLITDKQSDRVIGPGGVEECGIEWYLWPRDDGLFSPPHILIKEHESFPILLRKEGGKLLFRHKIIGIAAPAKDISMLESIYEFLKANRELVEFMAAFGAQYLIGRQAALLKKNIMDLPYQEGGQIVFRGVQKYL